MPSRKKEPVEELKKLFKRVLAACAKDPFFKGKTPVPGAGPAPCGIMVVGEAPGRVETKEKKPFVGKAGRFLFSILEDVFGRKREEFYVTNVVKVWPTIETARLRTRKPSGAEEEFFLPFLYEEIKIVSPVVILAVGKTAFNALVPGAEFKRGEWFEGPGGVPVMPVYHPSYLLRKQKSLGENTAELKEALGKVKKRVSLEERRKG